MGQDPNSNPSMWARALIEVPLSPPVTAAILLCPPATDPSTDGVVD